MKGDKGDSGCLSGQNLVMEGTFESSCFYKWGFYQTFFSLSRGNHQGRVPTLLLFTFFMEAHGQIEGFKYTQGGENTS